jgi:hypothetical protein
MTCMAGAAALRRVIGHSVALLSVFAVISCDGAGTPEATEAREFVLAGETFVMNAPPEAELRVDDERALVRITVRPMTRTPSVMEVGLTENGSGESYDRTESWKRSRLDYRVAFMDGGSGGTEVLLVGRLALERRSLHVHCVAQSELFPESLAGWCLPYLRSLALKSGV